MDFGIFMQFERREGGTEVVREVTEQGGLAWCVVAGEPYVLHCLRGVGSIFHPIRDLGRRTLVLEGVYRWL